MASHTAKSQIKTKINCRGMKISIKRKKEERERKKKK